MKLFKLVLIVVLIFVCVDTVYAIDYFQMCRSDITIARTFYLDSNEYVKRIRYLTPKGKTRVNVYLLDDFLDGHVLAEGHYYSRESQWKSAYVDKNYYHGYFTIVIEFSSESGELIMPLERVKYKLDSYWLDRDYWERLYPGDICYDIVDPEPWNAAIKLDTKDYYDDDDDEYSCFIKSLTN